MYLCHLYMHACVIAHAAWIETKHMYVYTLIDARRQAHMHACAHTCEHTQNRTYPHKLDPSQSCFYNCAIAVSAVFESCATTLSKAYDGNSLAAGLR
jgi:hypothetical protein